jgi:anaerobic ribonucleoside-triphosphate reductase activating protein
MPADFLLLHLMHFPVRTLGPGRRAGIWFQGCARHCAGCVTPESWSFDRRRATPLNEVIELLSGFFERSPRPDGLTISGGEPFDQADALFYILRGARKLGVDDILIYSGYSASGLAERHPELPKLAAALVDGPFEMGNITDSVWKGSDNQSLTVWNDAFRARYEEWAGGKERRLQRVKKSGRIFLLGIPRQEDVVRLKNAITPWP